MDNKCMKQMFKQILTTMTEALSPKPKFQKLMTEIGGGWYMEKSYKGLPPIKISKLSKKAQDKQDEANKLWNYCKFQNTLAQA